MRQAVMAALLAAALGGCAASAQGGPNAAARPDGGAAVLTAVGTPFLLIAKLPVCIVTIAIAAPVAAVSTLSDPDTPFGHELRGGLGDGISSNCGPPFAVTP
jgi:hypothetical protein